MDTKSRKIKPGCFRNLTGQFFTAVLKQGRVKSYVADAVSIDDMHFYGAVIIQPFMKKLQAERQPFVCPYGLFLAKAYAAPLTIVQFCQKLRSRLNVCPVLLSQILGFCLYIGKAEHGRICAGTPGHKQKNGQQADGKQPV